MKGIAAHNSTFQFLISLLSAVVTFGAGFLVQAIAQDDVSDHEKKMVALVVGICLALAIPVALIAKYTYDARRDQIEAIKREHSVQTTTTTITVPVALEDEAQAPG
jgi:hypothetical protein